MIILLRNPDHLPPTQQSSHASLGFGTPFTSAQARVRTRIVGHLPRCDTRDASGTASALAARLLTSTEENAAEEKNADFGSKLLGACAPA